MTKIPAELRDPERREDELVSVTLLRAGWMKPVLLPRWVAAFIEETVGMLRESREQAQRERRAQWRHWLAGYLGAIPLTTIGRDEWWTTVVSVPAVALSYVALCWPRIKAKWQEWRER